MEPMKNHSVSETSLSEISLIDFYYLILLKLFLNHYLKSGSNGLDLGSRGFGSVLDNNCGRLMLLNLAGTNFNDMNIFIATKFNSHVRTKIYELLLFIWLAA